jgi:hypothetical protein
MSDIDAYLVELSRNLEIAIQKSEQAKLIAETNLFQAWSLKLDIDRLHKLWQEEKKTEEKKPCQIDWMR